MGCRINKRISFISLWIMLLMLIMFPVMLLSVSAFPGDFPDFIVSKTPDNPPSPQPYQSEKMLEKGKFLVASRYMNDPGFSETVIFLVDYSKNGAMGFIINRPTKVKLSAVLPDKEVLKKRSDIVQYGGPVNRNQILLIIRSDNKPEESLYVIKDIYVSSSQKVLEQIIGKTGKEVKFRAYAGYSGWSAGQLEREITMGGWKIVQADPNVIFDKKSSEIWPDFINRSSGQWVWITERNAEPAP